VQLVRGGVVCAKVKIVRPLSIEELVERVRNKLHLAPDEPLMIVDEGEYELDSENYELVADGALLEVRVLASVIATPIAMGSCAAGEQPSELCEPNSSLPSVLAIPIVHGSCAAAEKPSTSSESPGSLAPPKWAVPISDGRRAQPPLQAAQAPPTFEKPSKSCEPSSSTAPTTLYPPPFAADVPAPQSDAQSPASLSSERSAQSTADIPPSATTRSRRSSLTNLIPRRLTGDGARLSNVSVDDDANVLPRSSSSVSASSGKEPMQSRCANGHASGSRASATTSNTNLANDLVSGITSGFASLAGIIASVNEEPLSAGTSSALQYLNSRNAPAGLPPAGNPEMAVVTNAQPVPLPAVLNRSSEQPQHPPHDWEYQDI